MDLDLGDDPNRLVNLELGFGVEDLRGEFSSDVSRETFVGELLGTKGLTVRVGISSSSFVGRVGGRFRNRRGPQIAEAIAEVDLITNSVWADRSSCKMDRMRWVELKLDSRYRTTEFARVVKEVEEPRGK